MPSATRAAGLAIESGTTRSVYGLRRRLVASAPSGASLAFLSARPRILLRVARDEPSWLPVMCAGCPQRWYGIDRAHCAHCHRTFGDVALFDDHRVDHECRNPAAPSMIKHVKSGVWEPRQVGVKPRRGS